jgi:hypothetical protein
MGVGARLWLLHNIGTPLPFWDQWEELRVVYIPYFEGRLSLAELFAAHNEHRMFFNRFYDLAMLLLNGQWDNHWETVVNTFIYSIGITAYGYVMARVMGRRFWPIIVFPLMLALALPFAWENTVGGFHSQVYFAILFALPTLWLLGCHEPFGYRWALGGIVAIGSLCTPTSGILTFIAICALIAMKILKQPASWKRLWPTLAICFALLIVALALRVEVPHHKRLMAHSVAEFLLYFGKYLAWPWIVLPAFAIINLVPLLVLAWFYLRERRLEMPAEEMILLLAFWVGLQGAATAYTRGAQIYPQWRYMDSTSFLMVANCLSIAILLSRHLRGSPRKAIWVGVFGFWGAACSIGLVLLTLRAWQIDIPERQFYFHCQLLNTRTFLASQDIRLLDNKPNPELPLYEGDPNAPRPLHAGEKLAKYLASPWARSILPACVREPQVMVPEKVAGFSTNGAALARPRIPGEVCWGSCGKDGAATKGWFESLPIRQSKLPFLEFRVAGDLGQPGLSLTLIDLSSGKTTAVKPRQAPGDRWQSFQVRAPRGDFKIVARDESESGGFAFQAPREVGWFSWGSARLACFGGSIFATGLGTYLIGLVMVLRSRRGGDS